MKRLHLLGTPKFSTIQYYDRVLKDLTQLVFSCTEYEAGRLGKFLNETLEQLSAWKDDQALYEKECHLLPGFNLSFNAGPETVAPKRCTYVDFVKLVYKMHLRIARAFVACLEGKEYMEIRNGMMVLTKMVKVFPEP
jgi:THO complex subunit 2